ncbi:PH domain-containing protein [Porphyromonas gingivalis]|uniref:PH domain-containing protein n=1 Tax=Porphyromonas gingivalis TaxID=837 RepID=UPI001B8B69EC|nr:PH domain-containing protein [Porphyromonas gingivalis]
MSYIDKTLLTGETVTYKAQVHWWVFVYPMKFLLFGLLLISFSSLYIKIPGYVLIAIALWGIINSYLGRRYAEYVVTNKRVIFKLGLIRRGVVELQLNKAEAIAFGESFWGRIFNFGMVVVTTDAINSLPFIVDPLAFRREINTH